MKLCATLCITAIFAVLAKSSQLTAGRSIPLAEARLVRKGPVSPEDRVPIWNYGNIYEALGMTSKMFSDWEDRYGMDSAGVGDGGQLLIPGFPVFSKLAWTYIDPVDLSQAETSELVLECERAVLLSADPSTRDTFQQIRRLALKAIRDSAIIHFGPPYSA